LLNPVVKFSVPTVADGRVMVGTSNAMVVYGPPVPPTSGPQAPGNLSAVAISFQNVNLIWQDNSNNEDQFLIERSPDGSSGWTQIGTASANRSEPSAFDSRSLPKRTSVVAPTVL